MLKKGWLPNEIYQGWLKYRPVSNAGVIVLNQSNQVLLLRRADGVNKGMWEVSGGAIEKDETIKEAALRELQEETGIELCADFLKEVGTFRAVNKDKTDIITSYYAYVKSPVKVVFSDDEHDLSKWVDLKEVLTMPLHPTNLELLQKVSELIEGDK